MVTPSWPSNSGNTNDTNIENDVQQWLNDQAQIGVDESDLQTALAQMEKEAKSGNVFGAMMVFFTSVFPDVLTYQQDTMNTLADSQNIASDLRAFATSIQNDFNASAGLSPTTVVNGQVEPNQAALDNAKDLFNNTNDLNSWATFLSNPQSGFPWTSANCPLDHSDGLTITSQMSGIVSAFGGSNGEQVQTGWNYNNGTWTAINTSVSWSDSDEGSSMAAALYAWNNTTNLPSNAPSGTTPPNVPPANQVKEIQGNLQQANSAVSTMATTTQTTEQFYTNQYNQLTGIDNSIQQNTISEESSFVTNQKTS